MLYIQKGIGGKKKNKDEKKELERWLRVRGMERNKGGKNRDADFIKTHYMHV